MRPLSPGASVTPHAIAAYRRDGSWRQLEKMALAMVADAEQHAGAAFAPRLGGGTRLMLALEHRISHDIDLFIRDPQWIGYLTPRLNSRFETGLQAYDENAVSLKLKYAEGEIDFIVGMSLLDLPAENSVDSAFALEPLAEVLAKKLFYRGWALTPRDLFDWWSIESKLPAAIPAPALGGLLRAKRAELAAALDALTKSAAARAAWDAILAPVLPDIGVIAAWGKNTLQRYLQA